MNKTPLNSQIPQNSKEPTMQIMECLFDAKPSVLSKMDAKLIVEHLLTMLTDTQKTELAKKLLRCGEYVKLKEKGMTDKQARSIVRRKFAIHKCKIVEVCEPCAILYNRKNK